MSYCGVQTQCENLDCVGQLKKIWSGWLLINSPSHYKEEKQQYVSLRVCTFEVKAKFKKSLFPEATMLTLSNFTFVSILLEQDT